MNGLLWRAVSKVTGQQPHNFHLGVHVSLQVKCCWFITHSFCPVVTTKGQARNSLERSRLGRQERKKGPSTAALQWHYRLQSCCSRAAVNTHTSLPETPLHPICKLWSIAITLSFLRLFCVLKVSITIGFFYICRSFNLFACWLIT